MVEGGWSSQQARRAPVSARGLARALDVLEKAMRRVRIRFLIPVLVVSVGATACASMLFAPRTPGACPVHGERLHWVLVPTIYGLVRPPAGHIEASKNFPYPARPSERGCLAGPFSWFNRHDWVRACPRCTEAWKAWNENRKSHQDATRSPPSTSPAPGHTSSAQLPLFLHASHFSKSWTWSRHTEVRLSG